MFPPIALVANIFLSESPKTEPDVVITQDDCFASGTQLIAIRSRARKLLWAASDNWVSHFPVDRAKLVAELGKKIFTKKQPGKAGKRERVLTKEHVCHVLTTPSQATEKNHNDMREYFKKNPLIPETAREMGLLAFRIPIEPGKCQAGYDWQNSQVYNGVSKCEDVTGVIRKNSEVPVVMYATEMPAKMAADVLSDKSSPPFYMNYADGSPKTCTSEYKDTFSEVKTGFGFTLGFAMREFTGSKWSAWMLLRSCASQDGTLYETDDLIFDFGMRVFVPVTVEKDGELKEMTIVIDEIAAVSSNPATRLDTVGNNLFNRVTGGEYAKQLFLMAKYRDWKIEKE